MSRLQIHRVSIWVMIALSLAALSAVLSAFRIALNPFAIHAQPLQADEGTQAHVFQLAIVALAPTVLLFLATADGKQFGRSWRPLALSAVAVMLAFGLLYYFEHRS